MVEEHRDLLAALQTRDPAMMLQQLERHIAVPSPPPVTAAPVRRRRAKAEVEKPVRVGKAGR